MQRRSQQEYNYDELDDLDEHDSRKGPRKFKKEEPTYEKKKKWDKEHHYSRPQDYNDH